MIAGLLTRPTTASGGCWPCRSACCARLKFVGISDKYLQQDEPDQELAFQRRSPLEVMATGVAIVPLRSRSP